MDSGIPLSQMLFLLDLSSKSKTLVLSLWTSSSKVLWESMCILCEVAKSAILDSICSVRATRVWMSDLKSFIIRQKSTWRSSWKEWNNFCRVYSVEVLDPDVSGWSRSTDSGREDVVGEAGKVSSFFGSEDWEDVLKNSVSLAGLVFGFFFVVPPIMSCRDVGVKPREVVTKLRDNENDRSDHSNVRVSARD